jgi:hypothetical protein
MTNNKQQTAIELFAIALYGFLRGNGDEIQKLLEEFNEMQKQQHATTWDAAMDNFKARGENYVRAYGDFDEYYNETFGDESNS